MAELALWRISFKLEWTAPVLLDLLSIRSVLVVKRPQELDLLAKARARDCMQLKHSGAIVTQTLGDICYCETA